MSLRALTAVWDHSASEGGTLLVLLALADYADEHGWSFPSIGTLATKARLSERATQYAIRDLSTRGEIEIDEKGGPRGCNRYRLTLAPGGANSALRNICTGANDDAGGATDDTGGCNLEHEGVQPTAPKPPRNHKPEPPEEPVAAETREDALAAAAAATPTEPEDLTASDTPLTLAGAAALAAFGHEDACPPRQRAELDRVAGILERDGYSADDVLDADDHWRRAYERRTGHQPSSARLTQVVQHCAEWRLATKPAGPLLDREAYGLPLDDAPADLDALPPRTAYLVPPPHPAAVLWDEVRARLCVGMNPATFKQWWAPTQGIDMDDDGTFVVEVPGAAHAAWLTNRFGAAVDETLASIGGDGMAVRFVVATAIEAEAAVREAVSA